MKSNNSNKTFTVAQLQEMYSSGHAADQSVFSEMRLAGKIKLGDDFQSKSNKKNENITRINFNHIYYIIKHHEDSIHEGFPRCVATPINESEREDVKNAEMGNAVINWVNETNNAEKKVSEWITEYSTSGEVIVRIIFDRTKGTLVSGHLDEGGNRFRAGEFVLETIVPWQVIRSKNCTRFEDSNFICISRLFSKGEVLQLIDKSLEGLEDREEINKIRADYDNEFKIERKAYDASSGQYYNERDKIEVKEWYFRPTPQKIMGLYVLQIGNQIVKEQELVGGIFPICQTRFAAIPQSPRGKSLVTILRPFQKEISRIVSAMAMIQAGGQDMIFKHKNAKIEEGDNLVNLRVFDHTGKEPNVIQQNYALPYLDHLNAVITSMYRAAMVSELLSEKPIQGDISSILFEMGSRRKKFSSHIRNFEIFMKEITTKVIELSRYYLTPFHLLKIAGKQERVNIELFKESMDGFSVKIENTNTDMNSILGKQYILNHVLQYASSSMTPQQLSAIITDMPYISGIEGIRSLNRDMINFKNDCLSIERGREVHVNPYDDHEYYVQAITSRMKERDFEDLPLHIQQDYNNLLRQHEEALILQQRELQMNKGLLPDTGPLVTVELFQPDPATGQSERIKLPSDLVTFMYQKYQEQLINKNRMSQLPLQAQVDIAKGVQ
ncbi:MAG: hypothetical protein HQK52_19680 [Oligoflexia bacterium]|nr:hypothetical protein [Oligoflexia bacterium]